MPVLKQQRARPAMKEAIVLDLSDIGAQAERLRREAEQRAEQIVAEAQAQAEQIIAGAEKKGLEKGLAEGRAQGEAQGVEQGRAQALAEGAEQLQQMSAAWQAALTDWDAQAGRVMQDAKQEVLTFALRLAERLVHRVIEFDPTVVVDQVEEALGHVLQPLDVTVRVHPQDVKLIVEALGELKDRFDHIETVDLKADEQITRGGCRVSFGKGAVDATIERQIERLVDLILPDDGGETEAEAQTEATTDFADDADEGNEDEQQPQ